MHLRRRGRTLTGLCPFHNEKTPSFTVYPDTQSFYCFGCGAAGDAITFVRKINNLGYVEAVKQLAARAGMPMPEEDDKESRQRSRMLEMNRCAARYFMSSSTPARPRLPRQGATGRKSAAFPTQPSAVSAWAMLRMSSAGCCITCAAAASPTARWKTRAWPSAA